MNKAEILAFITENPIAFLATTDGTLLCLGAR